MTHSSIAKAWDAGRAAVGGWVSAGGEFSINLYRQAGYDYVGVDCQHAAVSEADVMQILLRSHASAPATIVRVSKNDAALIGKLADGGADGIIVPSVNTAQEAAQAVAATRYPPDGIRSFGPMRADLRMADLPELSARVDVFAMIETADGLRNVEEICRVRGLRGVYVGLDDLSISLGLDRKAAFSSAEMAAHVARIGEACRSAGVILGMHQPDGTTAREWIARGVRLVSLGADSRLFLRAAIADLQGVAPPGL